MEEHVFVKMIETLDTKELAALLKIASRKLLVLRAEAEDAAFWHENLERIAKWLEAIPMLNDDEKTFIIGSSNHGINGRIRAIVNMRKRTGMRLRDCQKIVDKWIGENNVQKV